MDLLEKERIPGDKAASHWYYRSKYGVMSACLRGLANGAAPSLLDYGCGSGVFLAMLADDPRFRGWKLAGFDPRLPSDPQAPLLHPGIGRTLPPAGSQDVVLLMDVLEHVDDDGALLADALSLCRPGGLLFITVPAFRWLWSAHDVFLGHRRRYTRHDLLELLDRCPDQSGATAHYYYAAILPMAVPVRWLRRGAPALSSDLRPHGHWINATLSGLLAMEAVLARFNHLGGLSVVAACRRNGP